MKLYEIHAALEALDSYVNWYAEEHEGEITPDLELKLDALELEYKDKLENLGRLIKHTEAHEQALADEIKRLQARKAQAERKAEWLRGYVMQHLNGAKFESATVCYSLRRSEIVEVPDETLVPEQWLKPQPPKVDKAGIKERLKAGDEFSFARLVEKYNLQVK